MEANSASETSSSFKLSDDEKWDKMLRTAALGILENAQDQNFRNIVEAFISKQFDGDDNTLLSTINGYFQNTLLIDFQSSINANSQILNNDVFFASTEIEECINGFSYYDDSAFIQVFIPFYDQINKSGSPIVCINYEDDDKCLGLYYDSNGIIQIMEVDESYASSHYVWVISVNESIGASSSLSGLGTKGPNPTSEDLLVRLDSIIYTDQKEGWANGRGDIAYITFKYSFCGMPFWDSDPIAKFKNDCFDKISEKELNEVIKYTDFRLCWDEPENDVFRPDEKLGIMFYEKDRKHKKSSHNIQWASCVFNGYYNYWSKEDPYITTQTERNSYGQLSDFTPIQLVPGSFGPEYLANSGATFYVSMKNWTN